VNATRQLPGDRTPRLRPWWHVGVPFWIGAVMVGAIGIAGRNPLALLFMLVFAGWGLAWSLSARRGVARHAKLIAAATGLLTDPTVEHALWLGPATLLLRPRRPGHLLWVPGGTVWTASEVSTLADPARRVLAGSFESDLSLRFDELMNLRLETGVLSGQYLVVECVGGDVYRFRLPEPATYPFLLRALESRG